MYRTRYARFGKEGDCVRNDVPMLSYQFISIPVLEDDISMSAIEMNDDLDGVHLHDILVGHDA